MKTLIVLIVVVGVGLVVLIVRSARERANRNHDPIEYYLGWGRYSHPISLEKRVTKEAAQAAAARGSAYLIAYFEQWFRSKPLAMRARQDHPCTSRVHNCSATGEMTDPSM